MKQANVEDIYPLSPLQEGMLFHSLLEPGGGLYLDQIVTAITDPRGFDLGALRFACQRLAARHSVLRTAFHWRQDKPRQIVLRQVELPVTELDWRTLPPDAQTKELELFLRADRLRGFDLAVPPLVRLTQIRQSAERCHLLVTYHHALMDAWSVPIVFTELMAFYQAYRQGEELELPRTRPYRDYIAWLEKQDQQAAEAYWRRTLGSFTSPTSLGVDRASIQDGELGKVAVALSEPLSAALEQLARRHQATLNTLVQGAWALLLSRYGGERDTVFGVTVSGRPPRLAGVETMVGLFINTLPLRVCVEPEAGLAAWLRRLCALSFDLQLYEYSSLADIRRWIGFPAGLPLFESIVVFENIPGVPASDGSRPDAFAVGESRYLARSNLPLALVARPGRALTLEILFHGGRFESTTVDRMLRHLVHLLSLFPDSEQGRLADLSLLAPSEREQILHDCNGTETAYPRHLSIPQLFALQVERSPDAVAVIQGEEVLTYRDLALRSSALARCLQASGAGPEVLVGLLAERSSEAVAGMLGILQAGAAYLPLDPAWPDERLSLVLREAGVRIVLAADRFASRCSDADLTVLVLSAPETVATAAALAPRAVTPDHLAYVMFTSGSSGVPKGVAVTHRNVVRLVRDTDYLQPDSSSVFLHAAPPTFDASTLEIWGPLLNGGRLVILPAGFTLAEIAGTVQRHGINTVWLTAGLFREMVDQHLTGLSGVAHLLAGGDVVSPAPVRQVLAAFPGCEVINGYGPTENTTFTTTFRRAAGDDVADPLPIGRPIANTQAYILDADFQPVPAGVRGELFAGGEGLARGYHRQPDLTAEKFLPHPFSDRPGARLYRTGDIARHQVDGTIEFLGRYDHQVKIRGYRIELGEIEAVLARHPQVRESIVLVVGSPAGGKELAAFIVPDETTASGVEGLRNVLERQLPAAMVPALLVLRQSLPLTPNGKVDRKALAASLATEPLRSAAATMPRDPLELALLGIWEDVFTRRPIGIHDDFLDLGGHSLLALRLVARLRRRFGRELPLASFFSAGTIAGVADLLRQERDSSPVPSCLVAIQPEGTQTPFFCVHPGGGNVFCYTTLAYHLGPDRPFYGLQARGREEGDEPLTTVADMASLYLEAVRRVQPLGPYLLGGWSFGGLVAYEMAQRLMAAGAEVGVLALLDVGLWSTSSVQDDAEVLADLLAPQVRIPPEELRRLGSLEEQLERVLEVARQHELLTFDIDVAHARRLYRVYRANSAAARTYKPQVYPGSLVLFRSLNQTGKPPDDPALGWGGLALGGVEIHEVPAPHETLVLEPGVRILAEQLISCFERAASRRLTDLGSIFNRP
ncbi:MAG TPA: amino acid adenylation domain-containing protein [Thermoanaerobaculia bacterium]|jgi:amino acid adenylation domain-containing protein|nr:amino acid adenylation domain-containing protein [Thermoanaerobaculia bacterium]